VGSRVLRSALLPVQRMTEKAERIGIDRLDGRLAAPNPSDEIGRLAATLNAMLDRLQAGVGVKRQLIADASHELRTPLAAMRAELDISLRDGPRSPAERELIESLREDADSMSRTVDNLLELAQADEGRLELVRTRVDLAEVIEAGTRPLLALAEAKGVALRTDTERCGAADADPQRLQHALTNMIENAIKFTPEGGEITVSCWSAGGEVGFTVADNGVGVPAEARAHLFDRFYRADRSRSRASGGSGLGLAICYEIATAHGGRIWVESEEGEGSAFSIALPAYEGGPAGPTASGPPIRTQSRPARLAS
jgi:signal transduction histidine kinase